jgi:hypothetical protein
VGISVKRRVKHYVLLLREGYLLELHTKVKPEEKSVVWRSSLLSCPSRQGACEIPVIGNAAGWDSTARIMMLTGTCILSLGEVCAY